MIKYLLLRKSRKRTNILDDDESGVFWTMFLLFSSRRFIGIDGLVCSVRYLSSSVQAKLNCLISELRHQYLIYASHAILYHNKSIENKISSRRFFFTSTQYTGSSSSYKSQNYLCILNRGPLSKLCAQMTRKLILDTQHKNRNYNGKYATIHLQGATRREQEGKKLIIIIDAMRGKCMEKRKTCKSRKETGSKSESKRWRNIVRLTVQ